MLSLTKYLSLVSREDDTDNGMEDGMVFGGGGEMEWNGGVVGVRHSEKSHEKQAFFFKSVWLNRSKGSRTFSTPLK